MPWSQPALLRHVRHFYPHAVSSAEAGRRGTSVSLPKSKKRATA